jgi:hypothetical protein
VRATVSLAPKRDKAGGSTRVVAKTMPGQPLAISPAQDAWQEHVKINAPAPTGGR